MLSSTGSTTKEIPLLDEDILAAARRWTSLLFFNEVCVPLKSP